MVPRKDLAFDTEDVPVSVQKNKLALPSPPLGLFTRSEIEKYVNDHEGKVLLRAFCPECEDGLSCHHAEERKIIAFGRDDMWFQCGLRMWFFLGEDIELATTVDADALDIFLQSGHPAVRNERVISEIPPLLSWQFFQNDQVLIRAKAWRELLPVRTQPSEDWIGEGVVQMVDLFSCVVLVNSELQCIPKTKLRRKIVVGMMVEVLPGAAGILRALQSGPERSPHAFDGRMGFVTGLDVMAGIATVAVDKDIFVCV
jgi:hypothetical protein